MSYIDSIRNDKQKQKDLMSKISSKPLLVKNLATMTNIGARIYAPINMMATALFRRCPRNIIEIVSPDTRYELQKKRDLYMTLMEEVSDSYGFIEHECCDALLFTALVGSVGWKTAITKARDSNGAWHRRNVDNSCFPEHSASTISRDMLLGLLWYIWRNDRIDLAEELWNYGVAHSWIMGKGDASRIYFTPGLQATLAEIIYQLGGKNHYVVRNLPQNWSTGLEGYQCHLAILHVLLRGELLGFITEPMKKVLTDASSRYPKNTLANIGCARYAKYSSQSNVYSITSILQLEDENLWPKDRLPSDADRSSRWLFENNDLSKGSDKTVIHSGGDLIFAASLMLDYSH